MRTSKQQLKDELDRIYEKMTNPNERKKQRRKNERKKRLKRKKESFGL